MAAAHSRPVFSAPAHARTRDENHTPLVTVLLLSPALVVSACLARAAEVPAETAMTRVASSGNAPSSLPDFSVAGLTANEVRIFLQALQSAVGRNDTTQVAALVAYPITVRIGGQPTKLFTPTEFMDHYADIMSEHVKRVVEHARLDTLFTNYEGIRLGRGELWFAGVYEEGQETYRVRIIAINN